jgi:hypothetical protein
MCGQVEPVETPADASSGRRRAAPDGQIQATVGSGRQHGVGKGPGLVGQRGRSVRETSDAVGGGGAEVPLLPSGAVHGRQDVHEAGSVDRDRRLVMADVVGELQTPPGRSQHDDAVAPDGPRLVASQQRCKSWRTLAPCS